MRKGVWAGCLLLVVLVGVLWVSSSRRAKPPPGPAGAESRGDERNSDLAVRKTPAAPPAGARAAVARSTLRPATDTAGSNAAPETIADLVASPLGNRNQRVSRHQKVRLYLLSPVRNTAECQAVAQLCREAGYEPWMIMPAYNLAYEYDKLLRRKETVPHPPKYRQQILEAEEAMWLGQAMDTERRMEVKFTPAFLERLKTIRATLFQGQSWAGGSQSDVLCDRLDWDQLETVQLPSSGR